MHNEEWSGAGVAAALARLDDAGYSQATLARLTGINQSTLSRWGKKVRPGYSNVRKVAVTVWRDEPDLARQLVEASGYPWAEPTETEAPPQTPVEREYGKEWADDLRHKIRAVKGRDAEYFISAVEQALTEPPEDAGHSPGRAAPPHRKEG